PFPPSQTCDGADSGTGGKCLHLETGRRWHRCGRPIAMAVGRTEPADPYPDHPPTPATRPAATQQGAGLQIWAIRVTWYSADGPRGLRDLVETLRAGLKSRRVRADGRGTVPQRRRP